jgi:hypothetical protein
MLKDYRDDPEQGALYVSDDELLEIVSEIYLDFLLVAAERYQSSDEDKEKLRFLYYSTFMQAAFILEQQRIQREESKKTDTKK